MSIEVLVLLALFLLLPLVERALRSVRQRNGGSAEMPRPASQPSISPATPQPRPIAAARVQRTVDVSPVAASPPVRSVMRLRPTASGARHGPRRAVAIDHLQSLPTLRGAVVLMTILAPCLAVAPHDWGEGLPVPRSTARG